MSDVTEVHLKDVRLSFEHIFKAQKSRDADGTPKFNCAFLIDPTTKSGKRNIAAMEEAIEAAREKKWGEKQPKLKDDKICLRDGDDEEWDGYEGMMYVTASNAKRPTVVDRRGNPVDASDGLIYSGCTVNGIVRVWAMDNDHGKRVNASLEGVQFVAKGEAFGAKPLSPDAFDDLGDDEDDEDERPRKTSKKSRRDEDDEDEDERPRKKSKKSRRDEEDDEDERPRKKSKKSRRDYDDEDDDEDI